MNATAELVIVRNVIGDRFEAAVFVNNTSDHAVDAVLTPTVNGQRLAPRTLHLGPGAETRVAEALSAQGTTATLRFEVTAEGDDEYRAANTTTGTRYNTPVKNLPMNIEVLTTAFMRDIGALETEVDRTFNPWWGALFKVGVENSRFGEQVEDYACIYTSRVSNLLYYSPMHYFRARRNQMHHERVALAGERRNA